MALSRVKTWTAELLTSAELNAEFNNILQNPVSLISPLTAAVDMNGFELILDADADTSITADTDDRIDFRIGGSDSIFLGHATGNTGAFAHIDPGAFTATASTDIGRFRVGNTNALTVPAGTTAIAASAFFEEPNLTATGAITNAVTVYIEGAPSEGGANYALWVDAGNVRLDGGLLFVDNTTDIGAAGATRPRTGYFGTSVVSPLFTGTGFSVIDAKGDLIVGTAADTAAALTVGANGTVPMARSAATPGLAYVAALNKAIYGLTYANNGADAVNDIDIAAGGAMDATGAYWMTAAALTKQSDVAWAVGTAAGGLDTGAVGNSDYYIWLIARSDTGIVDALFSLSATAPSMPANYDFKRLIGWFKRVGGTIVAFTTYETEGGGLELLWSSPTLDVNLSSTLTTSRRTDAVKVPLNFSVLALLNVTIQDGTSPSVNWVYCPDQSDLVPSATVAPLANLTSTTAYTDQKLLQIRTSAAGLIAARSTLATVDLYAVSTMGFTWARRN